MRDRTGEIDKIKAEIASKLDNIFMAEKKSEDSVRRALKTIPIKGDKESENFKYMAVYIVEHPEYAPIFLDVFKDVLVKQRSDVLGLILIRNSNSTLRDAIRESGILKLLPKRSRDVCEGDLLAKDISDVLNAFENKIMRDFLSKRIIPFKLDSPYCDLDLPSSDEVKAFVEKVKEKMQKGSLDYKGFLQILISSPPKFLNKFADCGKDFNTEVSAMAKKVNRSARINTKQSPISDDKPKLSNG